MFCILRQPNTVDPPIKPNFIRTDYRRKNQRKASDEANKLEENIFFFFFKSQRSWSAYLRKSSFCIPDDWQTAIGGRPIIDFIKAKTQFKNALNLLPRQRNSLIKQTSFI